MKKTPDPTSANSPASERVTVRRASHRASNDRQVIDSILDAGLVAHVGAVNEDYPVVIPMYYVRIDDDVFFHGAPASGVIRRSQNKTSGQNKTICATVTLIDGLVLARSALHHSMNFRSVVVIGEADVVDDQELKEQVLVEMVDSLVAGRSAQLRPMTAKEVRGTSVLRLSLQEASAKVRSGGPIDDENDYTWPVWAGVVPIETRAGAPDADGRLHGEVEPIDVQSFSARIPRQY